MATLNLELPVDIRKRLEEESAKSGQVPAEVVLRILRREFVQKREYPTQQDRIVEAVEGTGLIHPLSDELRNLIDPDKDYEVIRRDLAEQSFDPPLSKVVMDNRGPAHIMDSVADIEI
jgi:hypothetical protein